MRVYESVPECVCECVGVFVSVCVCVADGCNFPTSISFPGLAMNKLCELFGQAGGGAARPKGAEGRGLHNKCKKSRATPAAQNKVTSTTTSRSRTSPKIDSIMCLLLHPPPLRPPPPLCNAPASQRKHMPEDNNKQAIKRHIRAQGIHLALFVMLKGLQTIR